MIEAENMYRYFVSYENFQINYWAVKSFRRYPIPTIYFTNIKIRLCHRKYSLVIFNCYPLRCQKVRYVDWLLGLLSVAGVVVWSNDVWEDWITEHGIAHPRACTSSCTAHMGRSGYGTKRLYAEWFIQVRERSSYSNNYINPLCISVQ